MNQAEINNKPRTDENVLYIIGWILLGVMVSACVALLLWEEAVTEYLPPCPLHYLTGLYCPGCGGTRAMMFLARGRILTSFIYHPLVPYTVLVGGWFMISQTVERISKGRFAIGMKYRDWYLWVAIALVAVNFVVKNMLLLWGIDILNMVIYA